MFCFYIAKVNAPLNVGEDVDVDIVCTGVNVDIVFLGPTCKIFMPG